MSSAPAPQLSVLRPVPRDDAGFAAALAVAAAGLGVEVELVVAGHAPAPARALPVFPLSRGYAVNRLLAAAGAAAVVVAGPGAGPPGRWLPEVLQALAAPGGRAARRVARDVWLLDRASALAAGGADHDHDRGAVPLLAARLSGPGPVPRLARRVRARRGDGSDPRLLRHLPPEAPAALRAAVAAATPLAASHRTKTHAMYAVPGAVLHLYVRPSETLRRSLPDRAAVRDRSPSARVPAVLAHHEGLDSLWLLEQEVPGPSPSGPPAQWWDGVSRWLVDLAGPAGPPLASTDRWAASARQAVQATPAGLREAAAAVLAEVGSWPSRHQHGDLQPKNVVLTPAGPSAVDWEGVWAHGVPGLDLLFLAVMAGGRGPDPDVLTRLARGEEPAGTPVLPVLHRLGVAPASLPTLAAGCLGLWALGQARREQRLGAPVAGGGAEGPWRDGWGQVLARR